MSLMKKAIGGSIHRIREFELEKVNLIDEFDILQIVGEGWFGKILLTEHRSTQTEMVLKALPKAYTGLSDFFREFHYGLHLAAHRNIITTYDVAFETAGFYVFSQEYAPLGDLTSNVTETGLGELHAKRVARQLAAAVHHIHSRELVHRDIKLDNILVFKSDFSRIKLCDFGETRRVNTTVRRHNEWLPYSPPEVLQIDTDETYKALTTHDVWQFGIVLFVCLTGCLPWQKAALDDPRYTRYQNWHNATLNIAKKPKLFQLISSRAQRMFKRLLDPKPEKRPVSVLDANKYLEDRWLAKLGAEKALNGGVDDRDELCPSMYSFHSSVEEKNQLLYTLTTYGIETTVDRAKKKDRIREWIQASAIVEEIEDVESDINEDVQSNDEEEPPSMQGRHFPERRPSAVSHKSNSPKHAPASKKKRQVKSGERRIPFAPQVAEERETTARFASFPNGDPKLAANANNGDTRSASAGRIEDPYYVAPVVNSSRDDLSVVNNNDQNINSTGSTSTSYDESVQTNSNSTLASLQHVVSRQSSNGISSDKGNARNKNAPKSPQPPSRKHRSQPAPFSPTASAWVDDSRANSTKRSQLSSIPHSVVQPDKPHMTQSTVRNDNQKLSPRRSPPVRAERLHSVGNLSNSTSLVTKNEDTHFVSSLEPQRVKQNGALSVAAQVGVSLEKSPPKNMQTTLVPNMPSAMTATSHLVMQSLNMLQGINSATAAKIPTASPMIRPNPATMTTSNSKLITPMRVPPQPSSEETTILTYGKDAYEHYGIAQGAILRIEPIKHSSSNGK